jgi:Transglycosylase SLT domain
MAANDYYALADAAAAKYGVPKELFRALVNNESGWNAAAVGSQGEVGLVQIKPATAIGQGTPDIYTPQGNLDAGAKYLAAQYQDTGSWPNDWRNAVAKYKGAVTNYTNVDAVFKDWMNNVDMGTATANQPPTGKDTPGGLFGLQNKNTLVDENGNPVPETQSSSWQDAIKNFFDTVTNGLKNLPSLWVITLFLVAVFVVINSLGRAGDGGSTIKVEA